MRIGIAALLFLPATTVMAAAMDTVSSPNAPRITQQLAANPQPTGARSEENMIEESWWEAEPQPTPAQKRFSRLQTDELASRLGVRDGKMDWARFDLKDSDGNGPAIAGTFDGGAAKMVLRWKQN